MNRFYYIIFFTIAVMLTACGNDIDNVTPSPDIPVTPEVQQTALSFAPDASAESRTSAPMQDTYDIFKVWTYKTTSTSSIETVMPGYSVKFIDDTHGWQYDGTTYTTNSELIGQYLKYWDGSATQYDFYAVAPVDITEGIPPSLTTQGITLHTINAHNTSANNPLYAHQRRLISPTLKDIDMMVDKENTAQPSSFYATVPLVFHPLLSKVEYRIYNTGVKTAVINNISLSYDTGQSFFTTGDYTDTGWSSLSNPNNSLMSLNYVAPMLLNVDPIDPGDYVTKSTLLTYFYEIPQSLPEYVTLIIDIEGEIMTRRFQMPDSFWQLGKNYIYYIHIAVGDSASDPIYINLTIKSFDYGDKKEETITNW